MGGVSVRCAGPFETKSQVALRNLISAVQGIDFFVSFLKMKFEEKWDDLFNI